MSEDRLQRLETEYFALRGKLEAGRITRAEFDAALKTLMAQDAQGRYWTINAENGQWLVYDGKQWVAAQPSAPPAAPPAAAPPQKGGGCGPGCLIGCGALFLLCIVAGGAAFWAYQTKAITLNTALNVVG